VLLYYLGGSAGITVGGYSYQRFGSSGVTGMGLLLLAVICAAGVVAINAAKT
jgi:hypothetical protein